METEICRGCRLSLMKDGGAKDGGTRAATLSINLDVVVEIKK